MSKQKISMPVKCLTTVMYDEKGSDWHFEKTLHPTWDDVVASIDRLDKFPYPWAWLFIGDETSEQKFADEEKYVTYDRELVLKIARYFGKTGEALPEAPWESV
jgi:hypothetical protein